LTFGDHACLDRKKLQAHPRAIVEVLTEGTGIVLPETLGTLHGVQAFLVRVRQGDGPASDHVVASAHHPRLSDDLCESLASSLRSHFHGACICFTTESEQGCASVLVPSTERLQFQYFPAAAAVATFMRVCGWDESESLLIRFRPSGEEIRLSPQFDDGDWVVDP
jgi:hypothetical protein